VKGNPINFNDPEGMLATNLIGAGVNALVGLGVNLATGQSGRKLATDFIVDLGVGFVSSGFAAAGKIRTLNTLIQTGFGQGVIAATGEIAKSGLGVAVGTEQNFSVVDVVKAAGTGLVAGSKITNVAGEFLANKAGSISGTINDLLNPADRFVAEAVSETFVGGVRLPSTFEMVNIGPTVGSLIKAEATEAAFKGLADLPGSLGLELGSQAGKQTLQQFTSPAPAPAYFGNSGTASLHEVVDPK